MSPIPYLTFQGTCREAMTAYASIFGGEIGMMMANEAPDDYAPPPGKENWVMHCDIRFADGGMLYASDDIMGGTAPMAGCSVMMELPSVEAGREAFEKLAEGGEVRMPYQATFWSPGFGTLRDRWGINWMISTTESLEAAAERGAA